MKTTLLSTLLVVLTSCSTSLELKTPTAVPALPAETRKPGAPTELEAQLKERSATLSLRFEGAGEDVSVLVSGIEGVTSSAELIAGESVKAGEVREFDVPFTRGVTGGHLVISVEGTFAGGRKARVHTVAIGDAAEFGAGVLQVTDDGDAVVMPAGAP